MNYSKDEQRGAGRTLGRPLAAAVAAGLVILLTTLAPHWVKAQQAGVNSESATAPAIAPAAPEPASALAASAPAASEPATAPATEPSTAPTATAATQPTTTQAVRDSATTQQATTQPASRPARPQPINPNAPITLSFQEATLQSVLEYFSEMGGLTVVGSPKIEGRITVMSRQPLSVPEAVSLLDTVLRARGYAAIKQGKTLKIVSVDEARKEFVPVRSGSNPNDIEPNDSVITQVIPIKNADAVKLKTDLASLIPATADVAANASSNMLIVTGTQATVRRLAEVIQAIDVQMSMVTQVKVFQLKYANAANAARLITEIFKEDPPAQQAANPFGGGRRAFIFPGMPAPGAGDEGKKGVKVLTSSDDRTNTLVVSASPEVLKVIDGLVKDLDSNPAEQQAVFIYHVRHGQATNMEGVLNNIFGWSGSGSSSASNVSNRQGSNARNNTGNTGRNFSNSGLGNSSRSGQGGSGQQGFSGTNLSRGTYNNTQTTGRTGGFGNPGQRGAQGGIGSAGSTGSDLLGQVYVVADASTNSLVVTTASNNFNRVRAIIADLDRAIPQVLIKVLVAEVTHDNSVDLGVEFSGMNLGTDQVVTGLSVGRQIPNIDGKPPIATEGKGFSTGSDFGVMGSTRGFTFKLDEKYVNAAIRAISNVAKLDVLSRPYILTADNQEAQINIGQDYPFITSSFIGSDGQVNNTVDYRNVGIILDVTPHINPQGLVTLDVYSEISSPTGEKVDLNPQASSPVFAVRYADSRVAIRDGQTIVIGGLMEDKIIKSVDKVPLLGDIPLVGLLFQRTIETKSKTELLIFLTPHVAQQPDDLKEMAQQEKQGTKIIQNAVEPGAFQDHLKGLERGALSRPASQPAIEETPVWWTEEEVPAIQPTSRPAVPPGQPTSTTQPARRRR